MLCKWSGFGKCALVLVNCVPLHVLQLLILSTASKLCDSNALVMLTVKVGAKVTRLRLEIVISC